MTAPNAASGHRANGAARQDQTQASEVDCATAEAWHAQVAAADKKFQTRRAQFAMAGWALYCTETCGRPSYIVSRFGRIVEFDSLDQLEAFARRVGVEL